MMHDTACEAPSADGDDGNDRKALSRREISIISKLLYHFDDLESRARRWAEHSTGRPQPRSPYPEYDKTADSLCFRFIVRKGARMDLAFFDAARAVHESRADKSQPLSVLVEQQSEPSELKFRVSPPQDDPVGLRADITLSTRQATIQLTCCRDPPDEAVEAIMSVLTGSNTISDIRAMAASGRATPSSGRGEVQDEMDAFVREASKEMHAALQYLLREAFPSMGNPRPRQSDPSDDSQGAPSGDGFGPNGFHSFEQEALAGSPRGTFRDNHNGPWAYDTPQGKQLLSTIQRLGAHVYLPADKTLKLSGDDGTASLGFDWDVLAGYETQKQIIEDTVLLALQRPEVYEQVAKGTRGQEGASLRPRGVLFEGPPGCGKTTSARVMASQASVPLVYIPLEAIFDKYYGQSERNLSQLLTACEGLDGCIIFLDELDSLATARSDRMYEATRRVLGVLLRFMDGFQAPRSIIIAATNRKHDLDNALLSRFDAGILFALPDAACRKAIFAKYAKQLEDDELQQLAAMTDGFSGRDIRDVCEQTERQWAAKLIRKGGEGNERHLPGLREYTTAVGARASSIVVRHHTEMSDV